MAYKDWHHYQESKINDEINKLIYYFDNIKLNNVDDLGCGAGNESVYMLKRGLNVTSIDRQIDKAFFYNRLNDEEKSRLNLIESSFEEVNIPKSDLLMAFFSIPFCNPNNFEELWNKIYSSINDNGYFVGELFGNRDAWKDKDEINTFTKEKVLEYLKNYKIIKFDEVEFIRESDNKKWHYFDIIAQKRR